MWQKRSFIVLFFLFFVALFMEGEATGVAENDRVMPWDEGAVNYRQPPYRQIEEWKADRDYRYDREVKPVGFWRWARMILLKWLSEMNHAGSWFIFFVILLGLCLIVLFLARIFNVPLAGLFFLSRNPQTSELQFLEGSDGLPTRKLEEMLSLYRNNRAYRESVRVLFLLYLRQLESRGLILFNSTKTNHDYLGEIKNSKERAHFEKRMALFNHVWYGQAPVSPEVYQQIEKLFGYAEKQEEVL